MRYLNTEQKCIVLFCTYQLSLVLTSLSNVELSKLLNGNSEFKGTVILPSKVLSFILDLSQRPESDTKFIFC